jgi:dynein regulatry complex protein 1
MGEDIDKLIQNMRS